MVAKFDTIKLKVIPGGREYKMWTDLTRCGILINDKDIRKYIAKISDQFRVKEDMKAEGEGGFGHLDPEELYNELKDALLTGERAYILCCGGCGEAGCYSARCRVRIEDDCYVWYDFTTIRDWDLGLTFRFKKENYEAFMDELRTTPIKVTDGRIIKWWEHKE